MTLPRFLVVLLLGLLLFVSSVEAALTTNKCLVQKLNAWSTLRKCQAAAAAKVLLGKPADVAKCSTKFQETLAKITAKGTKAAIGCRYRDNGNGTVTDYDTGLEWEQKVSPGGGVGDPNDVDNVYFWSDPGQFTTCPITGCSNGSAFSTFLSVLNRNTVGNLLNFACFTFRCDWRLPLLSELQSIVQSGGSCGVSGPCIDPIFGPTNMIFHWSSTSVTSNAALAWGVDFGDGSVDSPNKETGGAVRAVRNSL